MGNEFYDPGNERAEKVSALFARIAKRYDLINDVQSFGLHRLWKAQVVRLARPAPGSRALDVCCGTGDLAFRLAKAGANVLAVDFSAPMLEVARARQCEGEPRFLRGDAQQLPFADGSFDIVTVGYGLRNLADWQVGLREMVRVAKPGARLLVLDFGKPPNAFWRNVYYTYLRAFVPVLGLVFCGSASAYAYILESLKHYPAQEGVAQAMRDLGLKTVKAHNLLGGIMSINFGEKV